MSVTTKSNLSRLDNHETGIRAQSLSAISADVELSTHMQMIEDCMDLIHYFLQFYETKDRDEITIQLLGIRLFNTSGGALSLLTRGYYQNAFSLVRDLLETGFLLDYFLCDRNMIRLWRESSDKERKDLFSPVKVRTHLDTRDKSADGNEQKPYDLLCSFASHPTCKGFQMIAPQGLGVIGPFYNLKFMTAVIQELSKRIADPTLKFGSHFPITDQNVLVHKRLLETVKMYSKRYLGATDADFSIV